MFEFLAASAVVPSLLLIWYFHRRDVNPEPGRVVWATFFLGVLTVIPVLIVDWPIVRALGHPDSPFASGFGEAFLVAAIPEEFFKFMVILLYASRHKEFDEPMDGIVYGAVASLGFATLENILYVSSGGVGVAIMRAITAVPAHGFMGAIAGYYVGQAKFNPQRRTALLLQGYFTAVILHGLYDSGLLTMRSLSSGAHGIADDDAPIAGALILLTLVVLVVQWRWAMRLVKRLRGDQLQLATQQQQAAAAAALVPPAYAQAAGSPYGNAPVAYGAPQSPYGAPQSPYGAPQGPYGAPPSPFGAPQSPYAAPQYPAAWPNAAPQYAMQPAARGGLGAWVKLITGGVLASIGGLLTLAVILGVATGANASEDPGSLLIGTLIIGVLPLGLGLFLFARGIKGVSPTPVPAIANPYLRS